MAKAKSPLKGFYDQAELYETHRTRLSIALKLAIVDYIVGVAAEKPFTDQLIGLTLEEVLRQAPGYAIMVEQAELLNLTQHEAEEFANELLEELGLGKAGLFIFSDDSQHGTRGLRKYLFQPCPGEP